ncbi:MAG: hypothetical protein H6738_18490 [Alphaproteobacteria bacterium]|nr:hypothetical protein [Alphaproteobacteria bacterium]
MTPLEELTALRTAVALARLDDRVARLRVSGPDAWDLVDRALPSDLFLRDGQARPSVLLDAEGRVEADVLVIREGEDLWLWVEGPTGAEVRDRLTALRLPFEHATVEDRSSSTALLEVAGPFAWELMAAFDEPGIVGQPYLTLARLDEGVHCVRAGRSGEFTYDLFVTLDRAEEVERRLLALGEPYDLRRISPETLDRAALEAGFFSQAAEGRHRLTPAQLQLQARLSPEPPREAPETRVTGIVGPAGMAAGDPVTSGGEPLGTVLVAAPEAHGRGAIGLALLPTEAAHPGLEHLAVPSGLARTVTRPFVVQRSLSIKPQRDRYAARDTIPWAPGTWGQSDAPPSTTSSAPTT